MDPMRNTISWFEIPVTDFERAKAFYGALFDAELFVMPMAGCMMGFLPMEQGSDGVGGAIVQGEGYQPSDQGTLVYLNGGANLQGMLDRVDPAGGRVLVGKTLITEEIGYFAIFLDPEGNKVALHSRG